MQEELCLKGKKIMKMNKIWKKTPLKMPDLREKVETKLKWHYKPLGNPVRVLKWHGVSDSDGLRMARMMAWETKTVSSSGDSDVYGDSGENCGL